MIKSLIFDFDGVIVDSVDIKKKAFAELFKEEGKEVVGKVIELHLNNTGVSRYDKFKRIYKEILNQSLSEKKFKTLCDNFEDLVFQRVIRAPYVKGAKEFLEKFVGKFRYFLISATPQKEIEEILIKRNIRYFFKTVYGAPNKKTDAVKAILKKESLKVSEVAYVGDSVSDYRAANDNSVKFIAVMNDNKTVFKSIDCLKIKDFTYLPDLIKSL